jgi:uncharacterized protein YutE (UPF0331/DUF86 family)
MDRELIEEKIESLRRCVRRVQDKRAETVEQLENDWDTQDILSVNLTRAVQLCVDIAAHLRNGPALARNDGGGIRASPRNGRSRRAACEASSGGRRISIRNVAIHADRSIDWAIVHSIMHERLDDFRRFARAVLAEITPSTE